MMKDEIVNTLALGTDCSLMIGRQYGTYRMLFIKGEKVFAFSANPSIFAKIRTELKFAYRKQTDSRILIWHDNEDDAYTYAMQFKYDKKSKKLSMTASYEHMDVFHEIVETLTDEQITALHNVLVSNLAD